MKIQLLIIILTMIPLVSQAIVVTDPTLIALYRVNSERAYLEQLVDAVHQKTQLIRMLEQIRRLDSYLERYGDPARIKHLQGSEILHILLEQRQLSKTTKEILNGLDGGEVFRPELGGAPVYQKTNSKVQVDGKPISARDVKLYQPEAAARRSIDNYHNVRTSVLNRRQQLRAALSGAMAQLKKASTASEVQKLSVLVTGLQTELQAIDREIGFAESEASTRMMRNELQRQIERKAKLENERARMRQATLSNAKTFKIHWKPVLFNRNQ